MLCQKCAAKDEINNTSQTSQVDFKIMYILYENLIDKLKIKCKTTKGKPKVRFRWKGNVDELRDFVSLVLKKSGTWHDTRKSTKTFKTASLTVMYYMNTLTLQLRGNKALETREFLINLKETASSIKKKKGVLDSSSDTIPSASIDSKPEQYPVQDPHEECEYDTNDTSSQTSTISSCLSPTTTTSYTLWNEAVLNIDPDTPQLFIPEPNNTRSHRVIADLNAVEDDLLKLRKEKHEKWKKSKPDHTSTETQPHQKLEGTNTNVITTLPDNTNKLLGSIDVKGIISLLKDQISNTEKLQKKIDQITEKNFQLKKELNSYFSEYGTKVAKVSMTSANCQPVDCEQDKHARCDLKLNTWQRSKHTYKSSLNADQQPVVTSNKYEILSTVPEEMQSRPSFEVQMENIRLQRQVEYLRDRVAQSSPTVPTDNYKKTDQKRDEKSPRVRGRHSKNSEHRSSEHKYTVSIIGDSIVKHLDGKKLSNKQRHVYVKSFPGATSDDFIDYCKPIAKRTPDIMVVHVGTNDLKSKDAITVVDNIAKVKETIKTISPKTKVLISTLTNRYDNEEFEHKVTSLNEAIKRSFQNDVIDNSNLDETCVNKGGLHLSRKGTIHLAMNYKQMSSDL